jgi:hypothetical protein
VNNPTPHRAGDKIYDAAPEDVARYREEYDKAQALVNSLGAERPSELPDL